LSAKSEKPMNSDKLEKPAAFPMNLWYGFKRFQEKMIRKLRGKEPAAQATKQRVVLEYAQRFGLATLVETGTYMGDMVEAARTTFKQIYTIELFEPLYVKAKARFAAYPQIEIINGDSGEVIPRVVQRLTGPALFWLDGHYSGEGTARGSSDTPVVRELQTILADKRFPHVILIDDARLFKGRNDYPTVAEVTRLVQEACPGWTVRVANDAIQIFDPARPRYSIPRVN